jgi:hypothetical protein
LAQAIFEANLFSYKYPNNLSSWLFFLLTPPMKVEQTECSETSAYNIQLQGNHPKERIQHSEHGESLKSIINSLGRFSIVYYIVGSLIKE